MEIEIEQIQATLRPMLNKRMVYKNDIYLFKRFIINGNTVTVYTEDGPREQIKFQKADFEKQTAKLYPADEAGLQRMQTETAVQPAEPETTEAEVVPYTNTLPVQTVITKNSQYLAETLLNNISKLKANKEYIAQASEINNQVKTLIDLGKAELEAIKIATNLKTN